MRRSAVFKSIIQGAEFFFNIRLGVAGDFKGFDHNIQVVVPHCAGGELNAIAHNIVLVSQHFRSVFGERKTSMPPWGGGEWGSA